MSQHEPDALAIGCQVIDAGLERIVRPKRRRRAPRVQLGPVQSQPLQQTGNSYRRCGVRLETEWGDAPDTTPVFPTDGTLSGRLGLRVIVSAVQTTPGDWEALEWTLESAEIDTYEHPSDSGNVFTVSFDASDNLTGVSGWGMWPLDGLRYWSGVKPYDVEGVDFLRHLYPRSAEADAEGNPLQGLGIYIPQPLRVATPSGTYTVDDGSGLEEGLFPFTVITGTDGPGITYLRAFNLQPTVSFG